MSSECVHYTVASYTQLYSPRAQSSIVSAFICPARLSSRGRLLRFNTFQVINVLIMAISIDLCIYIWVAALAPAYTLFSSLI